MLLIEYSYAIMDLLDSSQLMSMYKANTILDSSETAADDTVISDEDQGMLGSFLETGAINVSWILQGYSQGIVDVADNELEAFEWDTPEEHKIIFRTAMPDNFLKSSIKMIDNKIRIALENFMLCQMAKLRGIDYVSYQENYDHACSQIPVYLSQRNKPIERKFNFY